jgi:signal transduction histidine kinase
MNLITNAGEANLPGVPGSITIRTREEEVTETSILTDKSVLHLTPGPYATLEVEDTGTGMPPDVMVRIFEPFFTTKFIGRGLGLAAVMGIIRGHGGGIKVESEPGHGSSFKLFLPVIDKVNSIPNG